MQKVTKDVIAAFLRGNQFWSSMYPDVDTVYKVFLAELELGHQSAVRGLQSIGTAGLVKLL